MATTELPKINETIYSRWSELDRELYNRLPYYFKEAQSNYLKTYTTWDKLITSKVDWTPNMGDEMVQVALERSPNLRQAAMPADITEAPRIDVNFIKERTMRARVKHHRFQSPIFNVIPSFRDFLGKKIAPYRRDLDEQMRKFREAFYRWYAFGMSPMVYVAGHGLVEAPAEVTPEDMSSGKTKAWFLNECINKASSSLTFKELFKLLGEVSEYLRIPPYSGEQFPKELSAAVDNRYLLVGGEEIWTAFLDDEWLKENRPIDMNVVTERFRGDIFGRIRFMQEQYPMRFKKTESGGSEDISLPPPEEIVQTGVLAGRVITTRAYAKEAQYGIAWLFGGGNHYQVIRVGPPPPEWNGKTDEAAGVNWSGKIILTDNILIPGKDAEGNDILMANTYHEYVQLVAWQVMGMAGFEVQNVIPIVYRRPSLSLSTI